MGSGGCGCHSSLVVPVWWMLNAVAKFACCLALECTQKISVQYLRQGQPEANYPPRFRGPGAAPRLGNIAGAPLPKLLSCLHSGPGLFTGWALRTRHGVLHRAVQTSFALPSKRKAISLPQVLLTPKALTKSALPLIFGRMRRRSGSPQPAWPLGWRLRRAVST